MSTPKSGEAPAERTLGELVERLHPAVLSVLTTPKGLDVPVSETVIFDSVDEGGGG